MDQHKKRCHIEDIAKDVLTTPSATSQRYDVWPYSESVLPLSQPPGLNGIQLPSHLDSFSLHPDNTGAHSAPVQSTQVADSDLEMEVDRFMADFWQCAMGDISSETPLDFAPFPC